MSSLTLGLDLGPNSIGWGLIDTINNQIVGTGVRIFPEGVDNFDTGKEESRNEARRTARMMRRQVLRRARRKKILRAALAEAGLFPADSNQQEQLLAEDPYELRVKTLKEKLTPHQIGRVLYHLNQRRGFKSLSKREEAQNKEVKGMLAEISELAMAMGDKTLGQHLAAQRQENPHRRIRNKHTRRDMLEAEFDAIWDTQAIHHPQLLTESLRYGSKGKQKYPKEPDKLAGHTNWLERYGIFGIIFFQRNIYWPASIVGLCELEPKERRCPKADRLAQRFRLLSEVNNLRYMDPDTHTEKPLTDEQRKLLLEKLSVKRDMEFTAIKKALGFTEQVRFNLERGKRPKLWGAPVDALLASQKAFGKTWYKRDEEEKNEIVRALLDPVRDEQALVEQAIHEWGLKPEQADVVLGIDFPKGYGGLSRKALENLLPHMERGLVYMADDDPDHSALAAAGYLRRDQLQRRVYEKLPMPEHARDAKIGDLPNPVVKRTLTELRKVVNSIVREYGKPDDIHIEMARSIKMGHDKRTEYNRQMREREAQRDAAAKKLREESSHGLSRDRITRYLLWQQQEHDCVYCGKPISFAQLDNGEIDVDHILPYSRSLDDSQMNKVVCHRGCNADKSNRTPKEWLASDPARFEQMCQRAKKLPYPKYKRFQQDKIDTDQFIARQLTDTAYISRVTAEYLRCLFDDDDNKRGAVLGLKGQYTSELRYQWGLHQILRDDGLDLKNREDHRHHAVDAIVLALTDRSRLQQLRNIRKSGGTEQTGEVLPDPWPGFREDVQEAVNAINVSHRVQRKVSGRLHEDTFYGPTANPEEFVARKPVEALSPNEIEKIRDYGIQCIIKRRLKEHGIDFGRGKKIKPDVWKKALADPENPLKMPSGMLIKKVRILKPEKTIQPIRKGRPDQAFVKPGNTHHLCIFEWEEKSKTKRGAVFVTMLEAINRLKHHREIILRDIKQYPDDMRTGIPDDAKFVMSLSKGEMILTKIDGKELLYTYKTAASTTSQMLFALHTDARRSSDQQNYSAKPNTLNARKVTVDPLGRIRWAND